MILLTLFLLYAIALSIALARAGHWARTTPSTGAHHNPYTRILIVGATGGTGRQLVAQALDRGCTVTAFVRNPSRLKVQHPRLRVIQGDVLEYESVKAAMHEQEAVLCALGHKRFLYPTWILSHGTRNILRAMETEGVRRLVCESSIGIGDSAGRLGLYYSLFVIPVILPFYFWDRTRQERLIAASSLEWVIVRPGTLTDGDRRREYHHGLGGGSFLRTVRISRADVADFMLNQLASDTYVGCATSVFW
ncbi:MAG: SDR family oxidoreductase [Acidobacteria bacterium]|nr:SDR family oxidoreductase [Acidobacteriota bacterium]